MTVLKNELLQSAARTAVPSVEPPAYGVNDAAGRLANLPRQASIEPLAYGVNDAVRVSGLGRTTLYALKAQGKLKMVKVAGRTLIPADSLRALIQSAT